MTAVIIVVCVVGLVAALAFFNHSAIELARQMGVCPDCCDGVMLHPSGMEQTCPTCAGDGQWHDRPSRVAS